MPTIAFGTGSKWKGHVRGRATQAQDSELLTCVWTQDVTEYVEQAIELGFTHIDTAQCRCRCPLNALCGVLTYALELSLPNGTVRRYCDKGERPFPVGTLHNHKVLGYRHSQRRSEKQPQQGTFRKRKYLHHILNGHGNIDRR